MEGMLTQEEVNRLLSGMCINDEEVVVKERTLDEAINNAKRGRVKRHMRSRPVKLSDYLSDIKMETPVESVKKITEPHTDLWGWYSTTENADKTPIKKTYMPEYSDKDTCTACGKEFDIGRAYTKEPKCPYCGQPFKIDCWIS